MFKKTPRPEIISLRLSEERMELLERHREVLSAQLGRPLSLSEAAFQLIERRAAEADRETTRHEIFQTPTTSLVRIRKKWGTERALSAAEWDLVAHYVQIGAEEDRQVPPMLQPAVPSRESYLALLDAFTAVYQQRAAKESRHAWLYFDNLGGHQTAARLSDSDGEQRHEALMLVIAQRRDMLTIETAPWQYPGNVGGCLVAAIRDEGVPSTRLDQALAPYWPAIWGLAARGHWLQYRQPIRDGAPYDDDARRRLVLPEPATAGDMTVSFASAGPELAAQLAFEGERRFLLVVHRYPELVEFRAMLDAPDDQPWHGRHFSASSWQRSKPSVRTVWYGGDFAFDFTVSEWAALRELVREAWASPALQRWLQELALEYGEHG